jgi:hypothetical protein
MKSYLLFSVSTGSCNTTKWYKELPTVFYICPVIERLHSKVFRIEGRIGIHNVRAQPGVHVLRNKLGIALSIKCPACEVAHNLVLFLWN